MSSMSPKRTTQRDLKELIEELRQQSAEQQTDTRNFSVPVHWRWDQARQIANDQVTDPGEMDPCVSEAVEFLRRQAQGQCRRGGRDCSIAGALKLFETDAPIRWEMEARLIAGETDEQIAKKVQLTSTTIATYEPLFCAVRDFRDATGYLLEKVVDNLQMLYFQNNHLRQFWAWSAMAGGPLVIDALVNAFRSLVKEGEPPTLGVYLRGGSVPLPLQAFVANKMIPPHVDDVWAIDYQIRMDAAEQARIPDALDELHREVIHLVRTFLESGKWPQTHQERNRREKAHGTGSERDLAQSSPLPEASRTGGNASSQHGM